jgi:endonuclease/exonuclease/phosphatase family metal-dependent hydrolase
MQPYSDKQIIVATMNLGAQNWMEFPFRKTVLQRIYENLHANIIGFQEFSITTEEFLKQVNPQFQYVMGEHLWDLNVNPIGFNPNRFTPVDSGTFWLSPKQTKTKGWDAAGIRATTWSLFQDRLRGRDQLLAVVNTHLDNVGRKSRINGVKQILKFIKNKFSDLPVIFCGDFNMCVDSPGLIQDGTKRMWDDPELVKPYKIIRADGFEDSWRIAHPGDIRPFTYHGFAGRYYDVLSDPYRFWDPDYIFGRNLKTVNSGLIDDCISGICASDHFFPMSFFEYLD